MRHPRFALSVMLGAMALSLAALGIPPCANGPAAGRDAPNAALICPTSSLAGESHPFRWFETPDTGYQSEVFDGWLRTAVVPQSAPTAMQLEHCDLSVAFRETPEAVATRLALGLCGLAWLGDLGGDAELSPAAHRGTSALTTDASDLVGDYRHSTGQAELMRINRREGWIAARSAVRRHHADDYAAQPSAVPSGRFPDDFVALPSAQTRSSYERFYRAQHSADAVTAWVRAFARELTSGLSELGSTTLRSAGPSQVPVRAISVAMPAEDSSEIGDFELVSDVESRFVYLRTIPPAEDQWPVVADAEEYREDAFEAVVDGPERFVYLRTDGAPAPPLGRGHSIAVILPRPFPPGSAIGIDADWQAWEYFTFQVSGEIESADSRSDEDDSAAADHWERAAWSSDEDTPREQVEAEEEASDGDSDAIRALIEAQAEAEGAKQPAVPEKEPAGELELPHAPPGCHGSDPVGCLNLRAEMRAQRWAASAAWSLTRLAALCEQLASRLRDTAAEPTTTPSGQPESGGTTRHGGCLEPVEQTTASQRFLSELYLGL